MLPIRRLPHTRIPHLRPLRPPSSAPRPRAFTQSRPDHLLNRSSRPQLPYLSQPSPFRPSQGTLLGPNPHLARLLSTESRTYVREQVYLAAKWTGIIWTFLVLGGIAYVGIQIEMDERRQPTPDEWSFSTRWHMRVVRAHLRAGEQGGGGGYVDWAAVGSACRKILRSLEDAEKDGKGIGALGDDGEGLLIPDVGKGGLDVSAKSWPWRAGYFEVIMSCAAAAEHLDGMVLDKTRNMVFPREVVIGPSNPDPRPVPPYMAAAPKEEDCGRPFEPPETYYMRVLTSLGFTTKQKLDAAMAYANWLEFKGTPGAAEEMYRWAVDIAKAGLPTTMNAEDIVDSQSNVLKPEAAKEATPNLLHVTTNLAIHHARTGNVAAALPIFLSVLRAQRSAPVSPFPPQTASAEPSEAAAKTDIGSAASMVQRFFRPPRFPPPPPSGDLPVVRASEQPTCDESELMLYIGEILFATSPSSQEGLGWTRSAVTIAEANIQNERSAAGKAQASEQGSTGQGKCRQCLLTGVGNWETMLRRLSEQQGAVGGREGGRNAAWFEWSGWFGQGGGDGVKGRTLDEAATGIVSKELEQVERLKERIVREGIDQEMGRAKGVQGGGASVWIG
ncbi:hypothetical protein KC347_g8868 [Hortaea werneckii]|nr:hypothetical protein KC347_g8868 [Hortaea werneckii]